MNSYQPNTEQAKTSVSEAPTTPPAVPTTPTTPITPAAPATSAPSNLASPKKLSGPAIAAIICAVLALGALAFGIFELIGNNQKSSQIAELESQLSSIGIATDNKDNTDNKNNTNNTVDIEIDDVALTTDSSDDSVREVITKVEEVLESTYSRSFGKLFNEGSILVKINNADIPIATEKTYGLEIYGRDSLSSEELDNIDNTIIATLKSLGFSQSNDLINVTSTFPPMSELTEYYHTKGDIACMVGSGIVCGHKSWVSDETIALANALAKAYAEKVDRSAAFYYAGPINDSTVSPYQTITASMGNAAYLFYRTGPDAEWQFFTGTQAALSCSDYNTTDLQNAFAGDICYDETTQQNSTVQPAKE